MYVLPNYKTKRQLREAVAAGHHVTAYQPNLLPGVAEQRDGWVSVEGPHYPEPHRWYARVLLEGGKVVKVK